MSIAPWKSPEEVQSLVETIKKKNHSSRLDYASFAVAFDDSKPFVNDTLNWGKTIKFTPLHQLWHQPVTYDFGIIIPADVWHNVLGPDQREPYLDLHLTRCQVEYEPEVIVENKKKIKVKDEYGRVQYTNKIKFDDEGKPKWKLVPLDLWTFSQNVARYGLWCHVLMNFNKAIESQKNSDENDNEEVYVNDQDEGLVPEAFMADA